MTSNLEHKMRRLARSHGLTLRKSRVRNPHLDDHGGYMLTDTAGRYIVAGERYELDLHDIAEYLAGDD